MSFYFLKGERKKSRSCMSGEVGKGLGRGYHFFEICFMKRNLFSIRSMISFPLATIRCQWVLSMCWSFASTSWSVLESWLYLATFCSGNHSFCRFMNTLSRHISILPLRGFSDDFNPCPIVINLIFSISKCGLETVEQRRKQACPDFIRSIESNSSGLTIRWTADLLVDADFKSA